MKKKRIFINMHYMELGGAERALLGLLYAIDTNKVAVDLFINQHTGPFMDLIPKKINLLPEIPAYASIECPVSDVVKKKQWGVLLGRLFAKLRYLLYLKLHRLTSDGTASQFVLDSVIHFLPSLKNLGCYDLAISFLDPPHIVQDKVDAVKKVEWIHTDFGGSLFHYDTKKTYKRWASNDYIISISDSVTDSFTSVFPDLKPKIRKIENIIPRSLILDQASLACPLEYKDYQTAIKICSVGRLSKQKNFESIPAVAELLKKSDLNFHWWIVGPGEVERYNDLAKKYGVGGFVSFIGERENPYPYMQQCDLYVQPSLYEGKAITVQEAQMLSRPVIITRYPTSASQVIDGADGIICEMDIESISCAILSLVSNPDKMQNLGKTAARMHAGNDVDVKNLYCLLDTDI